MSRAASFGRRVIPAVAVTSIGFIGLSAAPLQAQLALSTEPAVEALKLLGLSVAASGGPRDTLGLLVASVTRDGPADQAGITTGSRVLAVNGQPVRLVPAEIGQRSAADTAIVRFVRAVRSGPRGSDVTLRVAGGGTTRTVVLPSTSARGVPASSGDAAPAPAVASQPAPVAAPVTSPSAPPATAAPAPAAPVMVAVPAAAPQVVPSSPTPAPVTTAPVIPAPSAAPVATPPISAPAPSAPAASVPPAAVVAPTPAPAAAPEPVPAQPMTVRASEPLPVAASVATVPPAASTAPPSDNAAPATRQALDERLGALQLELRRLARGAHTLAQSDSLAQFEWELGTLRRRLRALGLESAAPAAAHTDSAAAHNDTADVIARWTKSPVPAGTRAPTPRAAAVPSAPAPAPPAPRAAAAVPATPAAATAGIEFAPVSGDLASYLGSDAASALLVVRASDAWEPLRAGDVVLQVDGTSPDAAKLRATLESRARVTLQLLRRGRSFSVTLGDAATSR